MRSCYNFMITNSEGLKIYFSFLLIQHYCVGGQLIKVFLWASRPDKQIQGGRYRLRMKCRLMNIRGVAGTQILQFDMFCELGWGGGLIFGTLGEKKTNADNSISVTSFCKNPTHYHTYYSIYYTGQRRHSDWNVCSLRACCILLSNMHTLPSLLLLLWHGLTL